MFFFFSGVASQERGSSLLAAGFFFSSRGPRLFLVGIFFASPKRFFLFRRWIGFSLPGALSAADRPFFAAPYTCDRFGL